MNSSDLTSYDSNLRKRCTLRLLSTCLGRSTPLVSGVKPHHFNFLFGYLRWALLASLYTYFLAKILQNVAKFIQKLTPGFKNHMRNLDNFRQAVESPKSWNLLGYFCPKIHSFNQNISYREFIITFNYLCENSPNSLCNFWNHKSFFYNAAALDFFSSNIIY